MKFAAGGTRLIQLVGRGGVPDDACTVLLDVTADAASAATDLLVDVAGWQRPGTETLTTQEPQRILDTRTDV